MTNKTEEKKLELLGAYFNAFNRHDVDALMSFMTDDCIFEAPAGPDVYGTRFTGHEEVRAAFSKIWFEFPDAQWSSARHRMFGDRAVSEWTFSGTKSDGTRVEVNGCDIFTFRGDKIFQKNAFRKNRLPLDE